METAWPSGQRADSQSSGPGFESRSDHYMNLLKPSCLTDKPYLWSVWYFQDPTGQRDKAKEA